MDIIFRKNSFSICRVNVPKGYPQSQTHAGVSIYNNEVYLTTSPYPNPLRNKWIVYLYAIIKKITLGKLNLLYAGEIYENPCIYKGTTIITDNIPREFILLNGSPLMNTPNNKYGLGAYCSDPDLYIDNDTFYILNRTSFRKSNTGIPYKDYETSVWLIKGKPLYDEFKTESITNMFNEGEVSPCLTHYRNKYIYFCLDSNSYNTGEPCKNLYMRESNIINSDWSNRNIVKLNKGNYEPWHMSVFQYQEKMYAIVACVKKGEAKRCWQMFGEFNDNLSELKIYKTPLTDFKSYRGAACVREDGEFVLYSTTVYEKIKGGRSVDGREVIMAHMPFNELLSTLKNNEAL